MPRFREPQAADERAHCVKCDELVPMYSLSEDGLCEDCDRNKPGLTPTIKHCGYIIELAEHGPWLTQDGAVTTNWGDRGIWHELADAELAMARSLK
jgi:hypothetical protein